MFINQSNMSLQKTVELAWCSGSVMDCHATAQGLIPSWSGVKTGASSPEQGTVNGDAISK